MRPDQKFFASFFQKRSPPLPAATPPETQLDLFVLRTGLGNWLGLDGGTPVMVEAITPNTALVAAIPRLAPQNAVLLATDGRSIAIEGDGLAAPAISVRVRKLAGGRMEVRHPLAPGRFLGVVTGVPVGRPQRILFDRVGDPTLDRFEPHPVAGDIMGMLGRVLLHEAAVALRAPMTADGLMALLRDGVARPEIAASVLRALPADELASLGARLLEQDADLALLRQAMPGDPWLAEALPGLLAWCGQGRPATRRGHSPASQDHAAVLRTGQQRPQAGLALVAGARRSVAPRRQAAILATARNEGPYLLDWLAHHRAVGFEHAVIYSNDNDDGSDDLLGLLADHGEITWVRNELAGAARPQWKAYGHAFKLLPDLLNYRWVMVLDLDEYLGFRPDQFGHVADYLGWQECQQTDAVALRWLHFVGGRMDMWRDAPSTRRFIRREPDISKLFKSIVRPRLFWDSHAHFPVPSLDLPFAYRFEDGTPCHHMDLVKGHRAPEPPGTADIAWVSHYVYRSAGEALLKASRGRPTWHAEDRQDVDFLDAIVKRFVGMADRPGLVIDERTVQCARGTDGELLRLRGLPGVRECDEAIKRRFVARMAAVTQAFLDTPPAPERPREYTQFQNILRRQAEHRNAAA